MGYQTDLAGKKRCTWWNVLKAILIIAAIAFAAYKIYEKFFKKTDADALDTDDLDLLDDDAIAEDTAFEVSAQDVIANPEE